MYRLFAGLLILAVMTGCEARTQVAADKIKKRIDKMLGELDVKRKQIDNEVKSLENSLAEVKEKRISAKVQLEQYEEKKSEIQSKIDDVKQGMSVIRPHLDASEPVEINGKMWEPAEIVKASNTLADDWEKLSKKMGGYENSLLAFERAHKLLATQEEQGKATMESLKSKIEEIDVKKGAIEAMDTAGGLAGGDSISDKFDDLAKEVDGLFVDVETAMRVEEEKISERQAELDSQTDIVSDLLGDLESSESAKSRLDEILGDDE